MKCLLLFTIILSILSEYRPVDAASHQFLGAIVDNRSVPASYWKSGVDGFKMTVLLVDDKTLAYKFGLKPNDLILKVDNKKVSNIGDLSGLGEGDHLLTVFRQKDYIDINIKIVYPKLAVKNDSPTQSNLPAIKVTTDDLTKKYGVHEKSKAVKKRSYQQCMEDEQAKSDTYEYYLNNPNTGYGRASTNRRGLDYDRARKICDEESDAVKVIILNQ